MLRDSDVSLEKKGGKRSREEREERKRVLAHTRMLPPLIRGELAGKGYVFQTNIKTGRLNGDVAMVKKSKGSSERDRFWALF